MDVSRKACTNFSRSSRSAELESRGVKFPVRWFQMASPSSPPAYFFRASGSRESAGVHQNLRSPQERFHHALSRFRRGPCRLPGSHTFPTRTLLNAPSILAFPCGTRQNVALILTFPRSNFRNATSVSCETLASDGTLAYDPVSRLSSSSRSVRTDPRRRATFGTAVSGIFNPLSTSSE